MSKTKAVNGKQGARRRRRATVSLSGFGVEPLALPEEELRRLVLLKTTRDGVEPFVRRMVRLMDSLQAGRSKPVVRAARSSKDPLLSRLLLAISREAQGGDLVVARNTALCAAGYAYQNSLTYLCDLLSYLSQFKQQRDR